MTKRIREAASLNPPRKPLVCRVDESHFGPSPILKHLSLLTATGSALNELADTFGATVTMGRWFGKSIALAADLEHAERKLAIELGKGVRI